VPTITTLGMDSGVAGLAKGNQIISCVSAALGQRHFVVDFLSRNQSAFLLAHLTQRMLLHIAVTDTLPSPSVSTAYSRVSVVLLVAFGFSLCVFLTEPAVS